MVSILDSNQASCVAAWRYEHVWQLSRPIWYFQSKQLLLCTARNAARLHVDTQKLLSSFREIFSRSTHHVPFFRLFITLFFIRPRSPSLSYYSFYVPLFAQFPDSLWFFAPFAYNFWSCLLLSYIQCSINTTCCHIFVTNGSACNLQNVDAVSTILTTTILNISLKSDKKEKVLSYVQVEQPFSQNYFHSDDKRSSYFSFILNKWLYIQEWPEQCPSSPL